MTFSGELRVVIATASVCLGCVCAFAISCTDGATPDCTGDAAASCGQLPNEASSTSETGTPEGGGGGTDSGQNQTDSSPIDMDSSTPDDSSDDSGDGGLGLDV
jgi:hypothetical protein